MIHHTVHTLKPEQSALFLLRNLEAHFLQTNSSLSLSLSLMMAKHHIVMLPYMAQGHLIPFLALAKLIEERHPHYAITLATTPLNVQTLRPLLPANSAVHLAALPFSGSDHGLPPNSDNSDSLPHPLIIRLMTASESLQPHFRCLIADIARRDGRPPFCIIADVFLGWTVDAARELGVFHATFTTCGGYGTAAYMSLWLHLPHTRTDAEEFHVPGFPATFRLHRSQMSYYMRSADGADPWSVFLRRHTRLAFTSDAMLCNTVAEVESAGVQVLRNVTGVPVWPVGPLLPLDAKSSYGRAGKKSGIELAACMKWLDAHPPASVLYVSFGSQNTISASQMLALARGLEKSGKPYVWVVRPPFGFDVKEAFRAEWLPEGFEARMEEQRQGLLIRGWAPQLEILSHGSVGAFVSHCGWNSVLESLSRGLPVVGWPLASEQFYNAKMMAEEWGVCVEVARGVEEKVEEAIRSVMDGEKGREMREKAAALAERMRAAVREDGDVKGSSIKALDDMLDIALARYRKNRSADDN